MADQIWSSSLFGPARRCRAVLHCTTTAPSWPYPVISLGRPGTGLTLLCPMCDTFICGDCAHRRWTPHSQRDALLVTWQLLCPLCATLLGSDRSRRAIWSAGVGLLAVFDVIEHPEPHGVELGETVAAHPDVDLQEGMSTQQDKAEALVRDATQAPTIEAMLALCERAAVEAPWTPLGWHCMALCCVAGGYPLAAQYAKIRLEEVIEVDAYQRNPLVDELLVALEALL